MKDFGGSFTVGGDASLGLHPSVLPFLHHDLDEDIQGSSRWPDLIGPAPEENDQFLLMIDHFGNQMNSKRLRLRLLIPKQSDMLVVKRCYVQPTTNLVPFGERMYCEAYASTMERCFLTSLGPCGQMRSSEASKLVCGIGDERIHASPELG